MMRTGLPTALRHRFRKRSCSGETLGETLVAVLVSSLAMLMLATAIMASVDIVQRGKQALDNYTKEERELATISTGTADEVLVTNTINGETDKVNVKYVAKSGLPGLKRNVTVVSYKAV